MDSEVSRFPLSTIPIILPVAGAMEKEKFRRLRKEFANRSVSELMDLLASDDLQTRFIAEMCLRDATST